ncbi:flagellar biosynthetic protein FliQ [Silvibacterium dinghuense]|uniref:Flagellar biosynthetic protein FliQ n=1 Tax=Silvibacterium dinghuense TaxID=1560006 RepID=A0A4V1NVG2_9BACT|nr:flagellar biosynthetic protein FliQ [Silvibacterium dinghuense]RXS95660.1 flagellar biosynthetic protein FliQ [Silvibacterium dinghuense]GGH14761.1 transporter [Silvibacterium dinghuense]
MTTDLVVNILRHMLEQAMLISAPVLIAAALISFLLSLAQTLTSLQEQTFTTVPRLLLVGTLILIGLPWFARRMVEYTVHMFTDLHRYLG